MRPFFITSSTPAIAVFRTIQENLPVNMSMCSGIRKSFEESSKTFRIVFIGTDVQWYFEDNEERDKEVLRILTAVESTALGSTALGYSDADSTSDNSLKSSTQPITPDPESH